MNPRPSFVHDDPRSSAEIRENEHIREVFGQTAGDIKLEIALGNLIQHYRHELRRLHDLECDVASYTPDKNPQDG